MPLSRLAQTSWGYRRSFFFRFAAVFVARPLLRNVRAFFVKMILPDSWAATDPRSYLDHFKSPQDSYQPYTYVS
ncbi:MAG TPA: hypothetical protein VMV69_12595 [Pirellulales bacterium]|nr:hypothetical protein [Pirellulales bacterium]